MQSRRSSEKSSCNSRRSLISTGQMDSNYTKGKIRNALSALTLGEGNLRRRVPAACAELMVASHRMGFEEQFDRIGAATKKVSAGDWTKVSDAEIRELALIIWRLNEGICD